MASLIREQQIREEHYIRDERRQMAWIMFFLSAHFCSALFFETCDRDIVIKKEKRELSDFNKTTDYY